MEIGCGNGHFLAEYCARHPEVPYLGVEIKPKRCLKTCLKIERLGLERAAVIQGTGEQVLAGLPDAAVSRLHIYFPDPWPKSRHRRRRFLRVGNVRQIARTLRPGGELVVATDFFDYYLQAKVLCVLNPLLVLSAGEPPGDILVSVYGKIFADKGRAVFGFAARRRD